jgi:hypothetical protein
MIVLLFAAEYQFVCQISEANPTAVANRISAEFGPGRYGTTALWLPLIDLPPGSG